MIDTQDSIEKLYGEQILKNYPAYGDFWNKYIGTRRTHKSRKLSWYQYNFPTTWTLNQKVNFRKQLQEMFMAHYSLFCNLAGAHYQIERCKRSLEIIGPSKHFLYWEAFECFYQHLGNVVNYTYMFWEKILKFKDPTLQLRDRYHNLKKKKVEDALQNLLTARRKKGLYTHFANQFTGKGQVLVMRNNIVHYARLYATSLPDNIGYGLPLRITKNSRWSGKLLKKGNIAHIKAEKHLTLVEVLVNDLENIAIIEFDQYLRNTNVSVRN